MKQSTIIGFIVIYCLTIQIASAQYLSLSYPKYFSVLQRDATNKAVVTIAGQLVWGTGANGAITPGTTVTYKIKTLSVNPNIQGAVTNLAMAANGTFFTNITLNKGWYLVEVMVMELFMRLLK